MQFNGSSQYVTFGVARKLGVETFTIETWFKRLGTGMTVSTGGVTAEPLVTKGMDQAGTEPKTTDVNFFLGINPTTGFLAADMEDAAGATNNHPLNGTTDVRDGQWHHAALTYDVGSTAIALRLYLDGTQQASTPLNKLEPRSDSIQHAALATAINSTGTPTGYFNGILDEVRIWNCAPQRDRDQRRQVQRDHG